MTRLIFDCTFREIALSVSTDTDHAAATVHGQPMQLVAGYDTGPRGERGPPGEGVAGPDDILDFIAALDGALT